MHPIPSPDAVEQRILAAAARLIGQFGFDKTTMNDIAREARVAKSTLYLRYNTRAALYEALLWHETRQFITHWLDAIEADPDGGKFSMIYKHALLLLRANPFLLSLFGRDRRLLGAYMQKWEQQGVVQRRLEMSRMFLTQLQAAGAIRDDLDMEVVTYLVNSMQYGLLKIDEIVPPEQAPSLTDVTEVMVEMLDKLLAPPGGGDSAAGKAVVQQIVVQMRTLVDHASQQTNKENS